METFYNHDTFGHKSNDYYTNASEAADTLQNPFTDEPCEIDPYRGVEETMQSNYSNSNCDFLPH